MMRPNSVLIAVIATAGVTALAAVVIAANVAGRRTGRRRSVTG